MLDVRRLQVLAEVARQASFSAAARELGYTQPAISRQIALLEREAGAQLLERRPGGVRLTPAGELLVGHAEALRLRLERAEAELGELLGLRRGRLSISTLNSVATTLLPPAIAAFRAAHPGVELSVSLAEPREVLASLRSGEVDLAISNGIAWLDADDVTGRPLFSEPLRLAVPADHPAGRDRPVALASLAEQNFMFGTADPYCPDTQTILAACRTAGFEPQVAFRHDDYGALLGFVAAGVGLAFVPDMVARSARPDVRFPELVEPLPQRTICLLSPAQHHAPARAAMEAILVQTSARWVAGEPLEMS